MSPESGVRSPEPGAGGSRVMLASRPGAFGLSTPDSRGMSLLEVLIAVILLAAILVPTFGSLHTGIQGTERVSEESVAANHAIALLERLSQVPYRKLPAVPADTPETELGTYVAVPGGLASGAASASVYSRFVTIEQVSARTENPADSANSEWGNLKRIKVSVRWRPEYLQRQSERTLTFQTLVTDDRELF